MGAFERQRETSVVLCVRGWVALRTLPMLHLLINVLQCGGCWRLMPAQVHFLATLVAGTCHVCTTGGGCCPAASASPW